MASPCTFIEQGAQHFLIFDAPTDSNIHKYLKDIQRYKVSHVVRVCDPSYSTDPLKALHIEVHDWAFPDGDAPPDHVINKWLELCEHVFVPGNDTAIGIHCVAGLGRAPVLVSIALIESGKDPLDAVTLIRSKRRGAINQRQLQFLQSYKPRTKKKCTVM